MIDVKVIEAIENVFILFYLLIAYPGRTDSTLSIKHIFVLRELVARGHRIKQIWSLVELALYLAGKVVLILYIIEPESVLRELELVEHSIFMYFFAFLFVIKLPLLYNFSPIFFTKPLEKCSNFLLKYVKILYNILMKIKLRNRTLYNWML